MSDTPVNSKKHICLTNRMPLSISSDPEGELFKVLADSDVLTLVRGLSETEARSPFTGGLFGMEEPRVNAAVKKMKSVGLISSRRDGDVHVYFLNATRFTYLATFLNDLVKK